MMDKRTKELLNHLHDTIHQILGHLDAEEAFIRSRLRFADDEEEKQAKPPLPRPSKEILQKARDLLRERKKSRENLSIPFPTGRSLQIPQKLTLKTTPELGESSDNTVQGTIESTNKENSQMVEFTKEEISKMPAKFRRLIVIKKKRCRMRLHACGKNSTTYEIRFRSNGYNVTACGKTIELAKANMLKKLRTAKSINDEWQAPTTFNAFALFYFENFRIEQVTEETYKKDLGRYKKHLQPYFKETPLAKMTPIACKKLLDQIEKSGREKTAEELHSLLSCIFRSAIAHGIIQRNPMTTVLRANHDTVTSLSLTKTEETELLEKMAIEPTFQIALAIALYTGLRPNELKTAVIEGEFIKAENSKRKRAKNSRRRIIEYKKIYICDKLRVYLKDGIPPLPSPQLLRRRIKNVLLNHMLKDLRKTFNSRCKELGVADAARKHFMGHADNALDKTYTGLSDEYLLLEGKKLNAW